MKILERLRIELYKKQVNSGMRDLSAWELGLAGEYLCPRQFRGKVNLILPDWLNTNIKGVYIANCKSECDTCVGRSRQGIFLCSGLLGNQGIYWATAEEFSEPNLPRMRRMANCRNMISGFWN